MIRSMPATPSTMQWWTLVMSAHRSPASPSTIHVSHSGRWRSSSCDMSRPIRLLEIVLAAGRRERRVADVVLEVEVRVVDPHRPAQVERDEPHPLAVPREQRRASPRQLRRDSSNAGAGPSNIAHDAMCMCVMPSST